MERFKNGEFTDLADAERKTGVRRQTISARLAGTKSYAEAHVHEQKLLPAIKKELVD